MSARAQTAGALLLTGMAQLAAADQQAPPAAASAAENRLLFSGNGDWLTGGSGGGGAQALWSHTWAPGDVVNAGAEYQQIANAHWTNAVLSGSLRLGESAANTLYGEAHEGAGDIGASGFHYSVLTAGYLGAATSWLTVQLEERRIDVDTSHGNLPKAGLTFHVAKPLLLSVSYADTVGGNLGTRLGTLRADYVSPALTAFAGGASGRAAPAVLNLLGQVVQPSPKLTEWFAGLGRSFGRTDWQLLADYEDLAGFKRTTVTLSCTLHLGARGRPP